MAVDAEFVEYVSEQMSDAGQITSRMMFGGCAIYCDGKVVALVGDDRLYVKQTPGGRAFVGDAAEEPPYEGAKPHFLIEEKLDDRHWLSALIRITASELPQPEPKKRKQ